MKRQRDIFDERLERLAVSAGTMDRASLSLSSAIPHPRASRTPAPRICVERPNSAPYLRRLQRYARLDVSIPFVVLLFACVVFGSAVFLNTNPLHLNGGSFTSSDIDRATSGVPAPAQE